MRSLSQLILFLFTFSVAGFADTPLASPLTLKTAPRIPADHIREYYKTPVWETISSQPITAYVILTGTVERTSGSVITKKCVFSFPDKSRDKIAMELARKKVKKIEFPLLMGSGESNLPWRVDIYLIFYESSPNDGIALIYARAESGHSSFCIADDYLPKAH